MDDVTIEAIKFNHDPNSATKDALTIRKNETADISVPEWKADKRGAPETSAVAYAMSQGNKLTIAVQLRRNNPGVKTVKIGAESKDILGKVIPDTVVFSGNNELSDFKILTLDGASIGSAGIGKSQVEWEWTLEATLDKSQSARSSQRTTHIVYTLLDAPRPPWGPHDDPQDFETPWTDVLDLACEWAPKAMDPTAVASMITRKIHDLHTMGKLKFDQNRSFSQLAFNGTDRIDFTKFLEHIKTPGGAMTVNCTDCAILVSTFANVLGCNLYQSQMGPRFKTNQILEIGSATPARVPYEYHEVAWEFPCTSEARLFDCFLELDSDPTTSEFTSLLPINIRFGDQGSKEYHFCLVQKQEHCVALDDTKIRRKIARDNFAVRRIHPEVEKVLQKEFDFSSWQNLPSFDRLFTGPIERLTKEFLPVGWKLDDIRTLKGKSEVLELSESLWRPLNATDTVVRILSYRCESVLEARSFLLNLLGDFKVATLRPLFESHKGQDRSVVGDLAFSGPEDQVLLLARSNVVVFLQNAGSNSISLLDFARDIDREIRKVLNQEENVPTSSGFARRELAGRPPSNVNPTIHEKEKRVMSTDDFEGTVWSSIRPPKNANPADMRRNGVFKIKEHDKKTGKVKGDYYDLEELEEVDFEGSINYVEGTSYLFNFYHDVPDTDVRRHYQGRTIADVNDIYVAGGRWKNEKKNGEKAPEADDKAVDLAAQNEGVWVITKP